MERSTVNMNLLERLQKLRGAESALGLRFCTKPEYIVSLPDGSRMFAAAGQFLFCFIDGYQETVFVMDTNTGILKPIAYDFSEFIRLVFSCGAAEQVACMALHYKKESGDHLKLKKIQNLIGLTPIPDPKAYMSTVATVIDCSGIRGVSYGQ